MAEGFPVTLKAITVAARDLIKADTSHLGYVRHSQIVLGGDDFMVIPVFDDPAVLIETREPEITLIGGCGTTSGYRAIHTLNLWVCLKTISFEYENTIVGIESRKPGILDMVNDILNLFSGNRLGLSGLEPQVPPTAVVTPGSLATHPVQTGSNDDQFVRVAVVEYKATTVPFHWTPVS
jgi:hypothetical protein